MALQRHINTDGMPPSGKRQALNIAIQPTHEVRPQPVGLTVGGV
jgi:hypothetical protein